MSERAIRKLKRKFVIVAMSSLIFTMLLISGLLYAGNLLLNRQVVRSTLDYIIENNGDLASWENESGDSHTPHTVDSYVRFLEEIFSTNENYQSAEFKFSTRYFAIFFNSDQMVTDIRTSHIHAVSESEADRYGKEALAQGKAFGRFDQYYYQIRYYEDGSGIIVYLDSSGILQSNRRLLYLALMLIGFGIFVAFFIVRIFATRAIRSEIRNAEIQKQFMTDASHELKTPLAVIRANTEMEEILSGSSEWTESTLRQIDRMNGLIKNLVMIARAEENSTHRDTENVNVTQAIHETVDNFQSVAASSQKKLVEALDVDVHMHAENAQLRQLCSLLVDNAIKYCDDNGTILVSLKSKGRGILLTVSNAYAQGADVDYTRFFERFYRQDSSHNIDQGGYGIGLSIAESLVKQYHGTINVSWKQGVISFTCQLKPLPL